MSLYSVKMRASRDGRHISGAERIIPESEVATTVQVLTQRALAHPNGVPDFLNVSASEITTDIRRVPELEVREVPSSSTADTRTFLTDFLTSHGFDARVVDKLYSVTGLRGAMLIDARTGANLSPDPTRGVRVSAMDHVDSTVVATKQHFAEAIVLASKVAAHPNIAAELCMSDDPDYTTGYLTYGGVYHRLAHMKELGERIGTRVFLYDGPSSEVAATIDYLENTPVLVEKQ